MPFQVNTFNESPGSSSVITVDQNQKENDSGIIISNRFKENAKSDDLKNNQFGSKKK